MRRIFLGYVAESRHGELSVSTFVSPIYAVSTLGCAAPFVDAKEVDLGVLSASAHRPRAHGAVVVD
ncbi:hypothetical protein GCM10023190_16460 [Enteractinococcus fodinae]